MSSPIRLAIAGVGNCASSLIQGITYYHDAQPDDIVPGLMNTVRGHSATASLHSGGKPPPIGRRGSPDDIASLVHFLAGPHARYLTGQTIHANGGGFMP